MFPVSEEKSRVPTPISPYLRRVLWIQQNGVASQRGSVISREVDAGVWVKGVASDGDVMKLN